MASSGSVVIVSYRSQPGRQDRTKFQLEKIVSDVLRQEPDCGGIEMLQAHDDPTRITLVERWSSREVFLGPHLQTEHILAFIARSEEFLAGPPDISFWRSADQANVDGK